MIQFLVSHREKNTDHSVRNWSILTPKFPKIFTSVFALLFLGVAWQANATLYYISSVNGDDGRSATEAQDPTTPWATFAQAISGASNGDSVQVLSGTYVETNIQINKRIKFFGNVVGIGSGVGAGTGVKPIMNGTAFSTEQSIFVVRATDVLIKNFNIKVNQTTVIRGIFGPQTGYSRIVIEDNLIESTSNIVGLNNVVFNSFGIHLGQLSTPTGADSVLIRRNIIGPESSTKNHFGRGVRMLGGLGMIGGLTPADSNRIFGDYGVQLGGGSNGGRLQVRNNNIFSRSACVEMTFLRQGFRHTIANNKLQPFDTQVHFTLVEIKNNTSSANPPFIDIFENEFRNFYRYGVATTRSRRVSIFNNIFRPAADSANYGHILINTKQQTSGTDQPTNVETTITGNDFGSNNVVGGTGIVVLNHNSSANPAFELTTIGGDDALANRFGRNLRTVFFLDTASGPSNLNPFWTNSPITTMKPVDENFNIVNNLFDMGSGPKRPADLSPVELLDLEDKIVHKIETNLLGFVTVKPNHVYVTPISFLSPFTTTPSVQRALDAVGTNDGFTLNLRRDTYPGIANVTTSINFDVAPNGVAELESLTMNGPGKILTMDDPLRISNALTLTAGVIDLTLWNLTLTPTATLSGGSLAAHVRAVSDGFFTYQNLSVTPKRFPVGTLTRYAEVELSNTGTADNIGVKVNDDVLSAGFTGTPVDSVVGITYQIQESAAGGSNLSFTARWRGADEKPFYDRSENVVQQFDLGSWRTVSATPVPATGSDPYSLTAAISGIWANQPIRIRGRFADIPGRLYYVDSITGLDSRTPSQAKNPNTPWRTIGNAIAQTVSGDSIQVFAGTYPEHDLVVNKSLTLLGNVVGVGVGPGAGTGVKPIINGTSPTSADTAIFVLRAPNINIRNFNIKVDQENISIGIDAPRSGFTGVIIEDNLIESTGDATPGNDVKVMSHAILLGRLLGSGNPPPSGNDSIIVRRNVINREGPNKKWFSRGVRLWGGRGIVGGYDPADGNEVHADFAIQLATGSTGGRLQTVNNNVFGRAAGIEYNTPARTFRHTIFRNTIRPLDSRGHFALIEIKSNIGTVGPPGPSIPPIIDIEENNLLDFYKIGVALTRSRNCNVRNNIFTPRADSTNYIHVWVSHKQRTSGSAASQPPLAVIETTIQGNTFNGNNVVGGYGIAFQNGNTNTGNPVFTVSNIGGPGNLANSFGANIAKVAYLDTVTGPSSRNAFWSNPGINWTAWPSTNMAPVRDNFDFSQNLFDIGTGLKLPAAMTNPELFALENKIVHKVDVDTLGVVTVKPNHLFLTPQSFLAPITTEARLQRTLNATLGVDDFTVNIEQAGYNGAATVRQATIFDVTPDGEASLQDLGMNAAGKVLTLQDPIRIEGSLRFIEGLISLGGANLSLAPAATVTGGSLTSHARTDGVGYLVQAGLGSTSKRYPVGTGSQYAEVEASNLGTADNIGIRVKNDVLENGTTGTAVDSVVAVTYNIQETLGGGSDLRFRATWAEGMERPFFNRGAAFVQDHNGTTWRTISGAASIAATGSNPYSLTADISSNWTGQPVRISSASRQEPAGNIYYVDDNSGVDSRTNDQARNPATPWRTITNALARVSDGDTIQVFEGTYTESNLRITKQIKLYGNVVGIGSGVGAGTGIKPIINGDTTLHMVQVLAPNVRIENFNIQVQQTTVKHGVYAPSSGFNNLELIGNEIVSTRPSIVQPCLDFSTFGVRLLGGGNDSVKIKRNIIAPAIIGTNCIFGRAIRMVGAHGVIGGPDPLDSNFIAAYYGIQAGDNSGGPLLIQNNFILGNAIEINVPETNSGVHRILDNKLNAVIADSVFALIEIKNNTNPGSFIEIARNQFSTFGGFGVLSSSSRNVTVQNNRFFPGPQSRRYRHIGVNSKQRTAAVNQPTGLNSISIMGNEFFDNDFVAGVGVEFINFNDDPAAADFENVVIGGPGAMANVFHRNIRTYIRLDSATGVSTDIPFYAPFPPTPMAPVSDNFTAGENSYELSTGFKTPATMTVAELYELEDKIQHKIDASVLGFVTVKPQEAYITNNSFLTPLTSAPSVQRGVNAADGDGWRLFIQPNFVSEVVRVDKSITFDASPAPVASLNGIIMDGPFKVLTLADTFRLRQSLTVSNTSGGKISIGTNNLVLESAATSTLGNADSYVIADTSGLLVKEGVTNQPFTFAIGTATHYAPVEFQDANNTGDRIGMSVRPSAVQTSFTPDLPTGINNYVDLQWRITESTAGGHNARLKFKWNQVNEINPPLNINTVIAREDGIGWITTLANYDNFDAEANGFSSFNSGFAVYADAAITTIVTQNPDNNLYCAGAPISIPFTVNGPDLNPGNVFTVQLSDPNGSFATFSTLPNPLSGVTSGVINTRLPSPLPFGTGYRFRVVSSAPAITGIVSTSDITINPAPARPVIAINGSTQFCQGESRTLTSSSLAGNVWSPGGATTREITVTSSGRFSVRVDSANNCFALSDTVDITVTPLPATPTIGNTGALTFCEGGSVRLGSSVVGGNVWSTNQTTDSITVNTTSSITLRTVANGCTSLVSTPVQVTVNPLPPVPTISANPVSGVVCEGENVTLTSSAANNLWSNGATTASITVNATASFTVRAISAQGCTSAVSTPLSVTVNPLPAAPAITASGDLEFCEGQSVTLTSSVVTGNVWSNGATTQNITVSASGSFTVRAVSAQGCTSATSTPVQVTVIPNPAAPSITSPAADVSICDGDSVVMVSSAATGNVWSNGSISNQIVVRQAGTFSVRVVAQGCTSVASASRSVSILPVPAAPTITPAGPVTVCQPESVTLASSVGESYAWSNGATTAGITVIESGTFTVRVIQAGCSSEVSAPVSVTVNPKPVADVAVVGSLSFCDGSSVTLNGPADLTYNWSTGATTRSITVATSETIRLIVTNEFSCRDTSENIATINNPNPTVTALKDTSIKVGEDVELNAVVNPATSTFTYSWTPNNESILSGQAQPIALVKPLTTTWYKVEVDDQNGCSAVDSALVRVGKGVYIPNMFSPNKDDKNPTFKVYGFGVKEIKLMVFNRLGQLVYESSNVREIVESSTTNNSVPGWDGTFKDKDLPADTYTWIISGKFSTGEDVKDADGKNSGSVTIIR